MHTRCRVHTPCTHSAHTVHTQCMPLRFWQTGRFGTCRGHATQTNWLQGAGVMTAKAIRSDWGNTHIEWDQTGHRATVPSAGIDEDQAGGNTTQQMGVDGHSAAGLSCESSEHVRHTHTHTSIRHWRDRREGKRGMGWRDLQRGPSGLKLSDSARWR